MTKGYTQRASKEYEVTYSIFVRFSFIRLTLAIVAHLDVELFQMHIKTAFSNKELD